MGRRTLSTLPTYRDLLKPELPDPLIVYATLDNTVGFPDTYPLDSDLFAG